MILSGDIGGTKTNIAFFEPCGNQLELKIVEKYPSSEHSSLDEIVVDFTKKHSLKVEAACFGIAGAIHNECVKTTNLPWEVKAQSLSKALSGSKVHLINDLEANAWGIDTLKENEVVTLQTPKHIFKGNRALISAGTGLGEAGLYYHNEKYFPFASEGGHADFAPRNDKEIALLKYLAKPFGHVSYERVLSGQGLYNIYQFLNDYNKKSPSKELAQKLKNSDPAKIISQLALENEDATCQEALEMMVSFYGSEAGNVGLRYMAYGGVYLGGGIAPKILSKLQSPLFLEAFLSKGRFRKLLESIPIKVILNDQTALIGAAYCAQASQ
ncbi:MAG: Glucokinase [Chlamydiae bacterium]|nr:Glucokinase [Chlamydiota bacterium]